MASAGPISVLHTVPPYVRARTRQLGVDRATYLSIILGNYLAAGVVGLPHVEGRDPTRKRVIMQANMPPPLRAAGMKLAARWNISFSRLMEALIVHDAWSDDHGLHIHAKTHPKPTLPGVR